MKYGFDSPEVFPSGTIPLEDTIKEGKKARFGC